MQQNLLIITLDYYKKLPLPHPCLRILGKQTNLIHKSQNGILHFIQVIEHFRKEIDDIENLHKTCLVILFYLPFSLSEIYCTYTYYMQQSNIYSQGPTYSVSVW